MLNVYPMLLVKIIVSLLFSRKQAKLRRTQILMRVTNPRRQTLKDCAAIHEVASNAFSINN